MYVNLQFDLDFKLRFIATGVYHETEDKYNVTFRKYAHVIFRLYHGRRL